VEEPAGRIKRRFATATGCSARLSWRFRAGANAEMAARGQADGREHEPARRRTRVSGGGSGYQLRRWSNSKAGADWSSGSAAGSCSASAAAHSGGPRAGAMRGGALGFTEVAEDVAHGRAVGDEGDDAHRAATAGTQATPDLRSTFGIACGAKLLSRRWMSFTAERPPRRRLARLAQVPESRNNRLSREAVNGGLNPPEFGDCRVASPESFTAAFAPVNRSCRLGVHGHHILLSDSTGGMAAFGDLRKEWRGWPIHDDGPSLYHPDQSVALLWPLCVIQRPLGRIAPTPAVGHYVEPSFM